MFTTPKGRLRLYNMTAFMLALALLWWVAWEAEYAGVATFGDGGDYLKLFAWGAIGATTRDAAVKWVKALGVAELTGST